MKIAGNLLDFPAAITGVSKPAALPLSGAPDLTDSVKHGKIIDRRCVPAAKILLRGIFISCSLFWKGRNANVRKVDLCKRTGQVG